MQENAIGVGDMDLAQPVNDRALRARTAARELAAEYRIAIAVQQRKSVALIQRQKTLLSAQAEQWRTAATEFNVNAALSDIPAVQSAMFRIAEAYERLARSADQRYAALIKTDVAPDFSGLPSTINPRPPD